MVDHDKMVQNMGNPDIERLKQKYSQEMKDAPDNPIKVCMKLVFESAIERNSERRSELAYRLSEFLTSAHGVTTLILSMIDFDVSSQKETTHSQRYIAVSNIITRLPKLCMPYDMFCDNIVRQLIPFFVHDDPRYSELASIIVGSFLDSSYGSNIEKNIVKLISGPLKSPIDNFKPDEAIIAIHGLIANHLPPDIFVDTYPQLFYALLALADTPSRLKPILRGCLVRILVSLTPGAACCLLEKALFHTKLEYCYEKLVQDSGLSLKLVPITKRNHNDENIQHIRNTVISLLDEAKSELLSLEIFFHFTESMWMAKDKWSRKLSANIIEPLLQRTVCENSTELDLLGIVATNGARSIELISRTLLNYATFLNSQEDAQDVDSVLQGLVEQSISSCLNILEVLVATKMNGEQQSMLESKCLPILRLTETSVSRKSGLSSSKQLAEDIRSLIEQIDANVSIGSPKSRTVDFHEENRLSMTLRDLNDKLVPVRVHALVSIKQMMMANDAQAVSRIPQIFTLIEASLADPEPYVFLACINLIAEMALRNTALILPKLLHVHTKQDLDLQHRLNTGEVLVRLAKQLNKTTPIYAKTIINVFIEGCKDGEELLRISSLTNLGEICHNLGNSLDKYAVDVLGCVHYAIEKDTIQVKCAAVDLLRSILSGLDELGIEPVQRDLKSIYRLLKKVKDQTWDERLCLHVDLAMEEVNRLARGIFSPCDRQLSKNIKVLSLIN